MELYSKIRNIHSISSWHIILSTLVLFTGCASSTYTVIMPGYELRTGSLSLEKKYTWDPLMASDYILTYGASYNIGSPEQGNLYQLYKRHNFDPLWMTRGSLNKNSKELLEALNTTWKEGLPGESYNVKDIHDLIHELSDSHKMDQETVKKIIELDIMFTNAYLEYASDLLSGKVNPATLDSIWEAHPRQAELVTTMENALAKNEIAQSLEIIKPAKEQYRRLTQKLAQYIDIKENGSWIQPEYFATIEFGDISKSVPPVKHFLKKTGDLKDVDSTYMISPVFDEILTDAVMDFQHRHGLYVDGVVGKNTLSEMKITVDQRIDQIRVNLERLRWLPDDLGRRHIIVNLPEYMLRYYVNDKLSSEMKIIIGEIEKSTPVLKDTLKYIVFNPAWNLPKSIAVEEILPKIRADSTYLERNHYLLLRGSYLSKDTIHPDSVNWLQINKDNFPFYIVKKPGASNPLGRVKFLFPNYHAIYLHDTPGSQLFNYRDRHFSHGCIRLEKPFELAEKILEGQVSADEINEILESEETKSVFVANDVMVHFIYQTAWVDELSKIHFRDDLYLFDQMTLEKLNSAQFMRP